MTTAAAARRAAEGEKVGSFLDAVRRPDSRPGRLTPATPVSSAEEGKDPAPTTNAVGETRQTPEHVAKALPRAVTAPEHIAGEPERAPSRRPPTGRQTETVIRIPATIDDVFTQLKTPWEERDRQVLVRSYSMDRMTTEMLSELHELYGVDMSTLVRQAVKALYVEANRRRGR